MPLPSRKKGQDKDAFVSSCMSNPTMKKEYPDQAQRVAVCIHQSKADDLLARAEMYNTYAEAEWDDEWDEFTYAGVFYEDTRDKTLDGETPHEGLGKDKKKGENVKLNKPVRTPGGPKKFSVYVKNDKGNVVKVNFGDPDMEIKRDDPDRRKAYRSRHGCENPGPKWKANYWSCKMWSKSPVSKLT